jgi:hypothetical protein
MKGYVIWFTIVNLSVFPFGRLGTVFGDSRQSSRSSSRITRSQGYKIRVRTRDIFHHFDSNKVGLVLYKELSEDFTKTERV